MVLFKVFLFHENVSTPTIKQQHCVHLEFVAINKTMLPLSGVEICVGRLQSVMEQGCGSCKKNLLHMQMGCKIPVKVCVSMERLCLALQQCAVYRLLICPNCVGVYR